MEYSPPASKGTRGKCRRVGRLSTASSGADFCASDMVAVRQSRRFRFGVFEADLDARELTKLGKLLPLQEQPFQLLAMLLEKPGVLVTREELRARLWPQTVVDFDHGLNQAINKIRDALGDSAENPRFIQTVSRRGYRFLADVTKIGTGQVETTLAHISSGDSGARGDPRPAMLRSPRIVAATLAGAALLLALAI